MFVGVAVGGGVFVGTAVGIGVLVGSVVVGDVLIGVEVCGGSPTLTVTVWVKRRDGDSLSGSR